MVNFLEVVHQISFAGSVAKHGQHASNIVIFWRNDTDYKPSYRVIKQTFGVQSDDMCPLEATSFVIFPDMLHNFWIYIMSVKL
jgi:hypothetical protein